MKEFIASLTWVDYLTAIAVLRGGYVGFRSGLFPELLRIAEYVLTVVVAFRFYEPLAQFLTLKTFLNISTATTVSFSVLVVGVFLVAKLITMFLLKLLKVGEGAFFYRLAGLIFGACRWVVILSIAFMLVDHLPLHSLKTDIHDRSVVGPKVSKVAPMLFDFLSSLSPQLGVPKKLS
ncbi:MAG: CvpA family protein [Candidatus Omnitrophica bacterium]|nr:CvpA family protein [Candidatus Omnitrophota bacterium]